MTRICFKVLKHEPYRDNIVAALLDTARDGNIAYRGLFGEEGIISREWLRRQSRSAKPNEIVALKSELERTGIKLIVEKSL